MEGKKEKLKKWYEDHKEGINKVAKFGRMAAYVGPVTLLVAKLPVFH